MKSLFGSRIRILLFLFLLLAASPCKSEAVENELAATADEEPNTVVDDNMAADAGDESNTLPFVLVTGANGLMGASLVEELLKRGHRVRAGVRNPTNSTKTKTLRSFPNAATHLEFGEFDLDSRDPQLFKNLLDGGVEWIFHVAALVNFKYDNPEKVIDDAVQGALLLLKAAQATPSVKEFVYTGSLAAVIGGNQEHPIKSDQNYLYTEDDWTNTTAPGVWDYLKMKTLTELAAWEFVEQGGAEVHFRLSSLVPSYVLGPMSTDVVSTSVTTVYDIMMGTKPGLIELYFPIVDMRDYVEANFRAATLPSGPKDGARRRFILTHPETNDMFIPDVARILNDHFGPMGYSITSWVIPRWMVWILSWFDKDVALFYPGLGNKQPSDSAKSQEVLGIKYHDYKQTILDTAYTLIEKGIIPKTEEYKKLHDEL